MPDSDVRDGARLADPRVNTIVTRCAGTAAAPHPFALYADRRNDPQPCPICGRKRTDP